MLFPTFRYKTGILESAAKIVDRMGELKALSQDVLKNSSDIENYNSEFKTLQVQLYQMSATTFNGVSLFAAYTTRNGKQYSEVRRPIIQLAFSPVQMAKEDPR